MARFNFYQNKKEDKIVYGEGIVDGIILLAVSEISYVELYNNTLKSKGKCTAISVNCNKDGLDVEVVVKIHFSQCVSDVAFKIQETIRHNVESMTDYHIKSVNVIVKGVFFDDVETKKTTNKIVETNPTTENVTETLNKPENTNND